jgi:chitin disaccharide deacetylase
VKHLIVNGDDFGQTPGVTAGIAETHLRGILTSTSMLVSTPFSRSAARTAADLPTLSVGLHVCLTDERARLTFDPDRPALCRAELRRQFERFVDLVQAPPTHLDSHHNVHRDARLRPLFVELAGEHSLPMREHSPVRYFSSFYGQWDVDGKTHLEQISVEMLERMLRTEIGDGITELSCHPGYVDRYLDAIYSVERETEITTLCAPSIRPLLDELEMSLVGFRDLGTIVDRSAASETGR